uniref:Tyrosine-protein kinase n=1 Tax=Sphaeramia orbicularis TaxID=375764 RepID=A0A673BP73_9TELE
MFPRVILKGTMIKKSQQKKRTSPCNYKERFFVLDTQDLKYSERRPGKKPMLKGCIELSRIRCVEIVRTDVTIPCANKYPFQVFHDNLYLYIFAPDNDCRQRWVRALKEGKTMHNDLVPKYHPNFWMDGKWRCCHQTEKLAAGCHVYDPHSDATKKPLPDLPDGEVTFWCKKYTVLVHCDPGQGMVVALQDYAPQGDDDLPLQKDHEYILVSNSHCDWWAVQDDRGNTGFVPSTYIAEKSGTNFQRFEWYNKNITRGEAEDLLMSKVKKKKKLLYVIFFSLFLSCRSNGEKNPRVKHYQIRQKKTEESAFYLAEKYVFSTIPELIHYHQHNAAGLITRLRHPVSLDRRQWELDPEELILEQELGSGQFGLVRAGRWREKKVAVKMVKEECMSDEEFKEEARVMMRLSHCKLVQLYGVCTQHAPMCLVFEFMENGALSDYLRARKGQLSQDTMLGMCLDVSEGMAYLESSNFIHRDLAARNCLVSKNNEVKVSDFGMTRFVLDDQYTSSQCSKFPVKWSSPEVIRFCKFSSKSDVWSFGVLMWEVYNEGRLPYDNQTNAEVVESLNAGLRLLKPRLAPTSAYQLMEWCWKEVSAGIYEKR